MQALKSWLILIFLSIGVTLFGAVLLVGIIVVFTWLIRLTV